MSSRSVSDIQTRAEGESLYIRYRSDAMFYRCTLGLRYLSEMSRTWHRQNYENTKGPHFKPLALPLPALIIT